MTTTIVFMDDEVFHDYNNYSKNCIVAIHENSEGLSSATNPKPKGLPSHCLLIHAYTLFGRPHIVTINIINRLCTQ